MRLFDAKMDENEKEGLAPLVRRIPQLSAEAQPVLTEFADRFIDGDAKAATAVLEDAPEEIKKLAAVLYAGGLAHFKAGDFAATIEATNAAVKQDKKMGEAWFLLYSAINQEHGPCDEALEALKKSLSIKKTATTYSALGTLFIELRKDHDQAEIAFRLAIGLGTKEPLPHFNLAKLLHTQNRLDDAEKEYRAAIDCNSPHYPTMTQKIHAEAHSALGKMYKQQKKDADALREFREAATLDPECSDYHAYLGRFLRERNDFAGAADAFGEAARLDESRAEYGQLQKEMQWKLAEAERKSKKNAKKNSKKSQKKK
jgi:tetratricopeptide (TPR) repeat protein